MNTSVLGRARRDKMHDPVENVAALAAADLSAMIKGRKTIIDGVGANAPERFHARAQLQKQPGSETILPNGSGPGVRTKLTSFLEKCAIRASEEGV